TPCNGRFAAVFQDASHNFDSAFRIVSVPLIALLWAPRPMIDTSLRAVALTAAILASAALAGLPARAQETSEGVGGRLESLQRDTSDFFGQLFGGSERSERRPAPPQAAPQPAPIGMAQMSPSELVTRLDRLENQIRQLTGLVEQLQYRNQQLEAQLQRLQGGGAPPPLRQEGSVPPPTVR